MIHDCFESTQRATIQRFTKIFLGPVACQQFMVLTSLCACLRHASVIPRLLKEANMKRARVVHVYTENVCFLV